MTERKALGSGLAALMAVAGSAPVQGGRPVTISDLKNISFKTGECSICGQPIGYRPHETYAAIIFDSRCKCGDSLDTEGQGVATWEALETQQEG